MTRIAQNQQQRNSSIFVEHNESERRVQTAQMAAIVSEMMVRS